jgi:class 3 adenylate cyclase
MNLLNLPGGIKMVTKTMSSSMKQVIKTAKGTVQEVVVVFCDIRGFSRYCSKYGYYHASELLRLFYLHLLNGYFKNANYIKLVGDGLLLIFKQTTRNRPYLFGKILKECYYAIREYPSWSANSQLADHELPIEIGVGISQAHLLQFGAPQERLPLEFAGNLKDFSQPGQFV